MPRGAAPGERRGGRAKGTPNKLTADIKALAQVHGKDAIDTLAKIMKNIAAPEAARISAAKELIDRGYGRAIQAVELSGQDGGPIQSRTSFDLKSLTTEQLRALSSIRIDRS